MLKFYKVIYKVYNNGSLVGTCCGQTITDENNVKKDFVFVNWENLSEIYHKYGGILPFNIWNFKKGRRISFFNGNPFKKDFQDIKEWKEKKLDIMISISYEDISKNISIQKILSWHDTEKAIQYLNERNLKIN